jgi:hypothetical protein
LSTNHTDTYDDELDELEPYCAACGATAGIFYGRTGWHHYRGNGTAETPNELYDAGHEPAVAWRERAGAAAAVPSPPWALADDGSHWRAQLADGRTAVIRRVLGEDGEGSSRFVPTVHESAEDFETGPECAGVLAAAAWAAERAAGAR